MMFLIKTTNSHHSKRVKSICRGFFQIQNNLSVSPGISTLSREVNITAFSPKGLMKLKISCYKLEVACIKKPNKFFQFQSRETYTYSKCESINFNFIQIHSFLFAKSLHIPYLTLTDYNAYNLKGSKVGKQNLILTKELISRFNI